MPLLKKLFGKNNRKEKRSSKDITPKQEYSPEKELGCSQKHKYKAINVEKYGLDRYKITHECTVCGDTFDYYTPPEGLLPYAGGSTGYGYEELAIDCYEAKQYDIALEYAQKAIRDNIILTDPKSKYAEELLMYGASGDTREMFEIIIVSATVLGKLEDALDICDKYHSVFNSYDGISPHIFHIKDILEHAAKYMIDNRESEFKYVQDQKKSKSLPAIIIFPVLRVINLLEKLKYLDHHVYGIGNGFSKAWINDLIRQLRELMIELNNKNGDVGKNHRNRRYGR
jgi:tetratricopeptide (TPR) repeat protein